MKKDKTQYSVIYKNFEYKGYHEDYFEYMIPFDVFIEGVRVYFDNQLVTLDGTDNAIWNAFVDLDCFWEIYDAMEDWFLEHCKEDAYEEFKEYVEEWVENDE